jgi:hypothetical protein
MNLIRWWRVALTVMSLVGIGYSPAAAQDLEPRAYSASPIGTTFLVLAAGRSSGGVFTDPSVPFEDVHAKIGAATVGAGHTFELFTRTALVLALLPYARGEASGRIGEDTRVANRSGLADTRAKLSVNLLGGRALTPREFVKTPRSTIFGVSLTAVVPTGQYYADRLVNIGSHRWAFRPEMGVSVPVGRWTLDGYGGVWLFRANDDFYPSGAKREQDPVVALQAHVSYTIRPGLWAAFNSTWYSGGTSRVDGVSKLDLQRNSRVGATVSMPVGARQSLKASYSTGATTSIGGDFDSVGVAWQMIWIR